MSSRKRQHEVKTEEQKLDFKKLKQTTEPDRKILIAVDFGTTFSGLAWAQTRKPDVQTPVIQWPDATSGGLEGITSDKVPTEIQYDGQNFKWGFQIGESEQRHQWFKLELDPSQRRGSSGLAARFPDPVAAPLGNNIEPKRLVKDYLTALRQHAEQILRYRLPQSALANTPIEYVITVPAVWSDSAQAKTRACAEEAGMGAGAALHIISEPEAAAVYALDAMDPDTINIGDTFVLCDAGGGTVDLISYTVLQLKPVLKISEATTGSGTLCGSSFLNRFFQRFLEDRLGKEPGWDEEVLEEAMKRFETVIKRQFRGVEGEQFLVPVPGLPDNTDLGVRRSRFTLAGSDVKASFEPVISEVLGLVLDQIRSCGKQVKAVFLVGGFGQNPYLRDRLRATVIPRGVEVMQSPNGWTAVVRGALMKALASTSPSFATVSISGRRARKYHGISVGQIFEAKKLDVSRRYWDNMDGFHRVEIMNWFMRKGSVVTEDKPEQLSYLQTLKVSAGRPRSLSIRIRSFSDPGNIGAPTYPDEAGIRDLVTVTADLSRIPEKLFRQQRGTDGEMWYAIGLKIEVTYYSACTKYELVHNGINYGTVTAEYV